MENLQEEGKEKVLLENPRINAKILEKIQALTKSCEGGDFSCIRLNSPPTPRSLNTKHLYNRSEEVSHEESSGMPKLNIWRVTHRLLIFGQCWNNSTENMARRNNTKELISFLRSNYAERHMIWCFTDNFQGLPNVQRIPFLDFDLGLAHRISCAVKCWLDAGSNNTAAFEIKNGEEDKIKFLISCVLRHCGFVDGLGLTGGRSVTENIFGSSLPNINTVKRYVRYFDSATNFKQEDGGYPITLKQLIITTVPHTSATNFLVGMKIMKKEKEIFRIKEDTDSRVYRDEDYIIFNEIDCGISEDVQILIYYEHDGREEGVVVLRINSFFYRQGLYRFVLDDVECLLPKQKHFNSDFSIDIVVLELNKPLSRPPYLYKIDFIQGLKILTEGFNREFNREIYEGLVSKGQNEIVSKFCAFLEYSAEKIDEFVESLESRGFKTISLESRPMSATNISFSNKVEAPKREKIIDLRVDYEPTMEPNAELGRKALYSTGFKLKPLNLIKETFRPESTPKARTKKVISKKKETANDVSPPSVVVKKPLHWTPLTQTEETIFHEISKVDAEIDYKRFEEMFCEPLVASEMHVHRKIASGSVLEGNRLFLVSLSLKHLELKNITPENIYPLLRSPDNSLGLQDLLNVERVYPNHEEIVNLAAAPAEALGEIEKAMLAYSQLLEVRKLVEILIFERKFFNEIFLIEDVLQNLFKLYNSILDSYSLRIVLKVILEIGNAVNFQYSANRKKARGFKLTSLYAFNNYRGKNDVSFFSFLFQTLEVNGVKAEDLIEELALVHGLKGEELPRICEKINAFIEMYTEKLEVLNLLEDEVKDEYTKFFGFACCKLEELGNKFKECCLHASLVKRKFGEDESKSSNEILVILSDFLYNMEQNLMLYGEKV